MVSPVWSVSYGSPRRTDVEDELLPAAYRCPRFAVVDEMLCRHMHYIFNCFVYGPFLLRAYIRVAWLHYAEGTSIVRNTEDLLVTHAVET